MEEYIEEYIVHNTEQLDKLMEATKEYTKRVKDAGVKVVGLQGLDSYHIDDVRNYVANPNITIIDKDHGGGDWPVKMWFQYNGAIFISRHQE